MSIKEMIYNIIDNFTDEQLKQVLSMLGSIKKIIDEEKSDDEFCNNLLTEYLSDSSADKHDTISLDDFAEELGIDLNEV